ncbi:MAG: hypothetical protein RLO48_10650 [Bauldia litoralis]
MQPRTGAPRARTPMVAIHAVAGMVALATILVFWLSTALSEAFGSTATVVAVKTLIPWGFLILIPAMAATGGSGFRLARGRTGGKIDAKRKRMIAVAANGILILLPSAFFLAARAASDTFDTAFYAIQAIELVAGAVNITLLGLNMHDGFAMTRRRKVRR